MTPYVEPGGSWRPFWLVAGALAVFVVLDLVLPGGTCRRSAGRALVAVLGIVAAGCLSARRVWTVRVDDGDGARRRPGAGAAAEIDVDHLRAVDSGVDAGAPVLGGGWSLPQGRTGLPLKLTDGRTVLVPTRDPAALRAAALPTPHARTRDTGP